MFVKPKYRHVYMRYLKIIVLVLKRFEEKSDFADAKALTEVISALAGGGGGGKKRREKLYNITQTKEGDFIVYGGHTYIKYRKGKKRLKKGDS